MYSFGVLIWEVFHSNRQAVEVPFAKYDNNQFVGLLTDPASALRRAPYGALLQRKSVAYVHFSRVYVHFSRV